MATNNYTQTKNTTQRFNVHIPQVWQRETLPLEFLFLMTADDRLGWLGGKDIAQELSREDQAPLVSYFSLHTKAS